MPVELSVFVFTLPLTEDEPPVPIVPVVPEPLIAADPPVPAVPVVPEPDAHVPPFIPADAVIPVDPEFLLFDSDDFLLPLLPEPDVFELAVAFSAASESCVLAVAAMLAWYRFIIASG